MRTTARRTTSPLHKDSEVLALLTALMDSVTEPIRYADVVERLARASQRSFDRIEQALRRLHGGTVSIGHLPCGVLTVVPRHHPLAPSIHPVIFDEQVSRWLDTVEAIVTEQVQQRQRGITGAEVRRAMLASGHPVTTQVVSKALLSLVDALRLSRARVPSRVSTRVRPRRAWGPTNTPLNAERILVAQQDQVHAIVEEAAEALGRPVSRAELKAWALAKLPGASDILREHAASLTHITRRLLPVLLAQHPTLTTYRPAAAARGTLGPRYAAFAIKPAQLGALMLEDAMERFAFGEDMAAAHALTQVTATASPTVQHFLERRAVYRTAALTAPFLADFDATAALALAEHAASVMRSWLPTKEMQKTAGTVYRRASRVAQDAPPLRELLGQRRPESAAWKLAGDHGLRDWTVLNTWHGELQTIAPRARTAPSILCDARRFPVPHCTSPVETAETAIDVVDALRQFLATSSLFAAKTLLDGVWMVLGTILRDPHELYPLLRAQDVPPLVRRAALVATTLLGGAVDVNPLSFAQQRQDLDALAFAAAVDVDASTESIVAVLEPIAARPVPMQARATQLIARAERGARLSLIDGR